MQTRDFWKIGRMTLTRAVLTIASVAVAAATASAQDHAMQQRGKIAMGVDQYTSIHKFDDRQDGGRIELQRDRDDGVGTKVIRAHLRGIAKAFSTGDFSTPAYVHMRDVPGTKVMTERRKQIRYVFRALRRGGELRITSSDSGAVRAVHEFLAFQRADHHAGGHAMHGESHE